MKKKKGFTLIEFLVVVLIIGVLGAIALPQYKKVVERTRMAEAVTIVKAIAQAQQRYYLIHNAYADCMDLDDLDIDLQGEDYDYYGCVAKKTNSFIYTSNGHSVKNYIAVASRIPEIQRYAILISKEAENKIICATYNGVTPVQKELCNKLNESGVL